MVRDGSKVQAKHREKSVGVRDYNGDGFPDLLIESSTETIAQQLIVRLSVDGENFNSSGINLWHFNIIDRENVIGVEKDGLTTIAYDTSALLSRLGSSAKFTLNQLRAEVASAGLVLETDNTNGALDTPMDAGSCRLASSGSFAENTNGSASFGALVCAQQVGDHVKIEMQALLKIPSRLVLAVVLVANWS
jgi:hypothetical protein